MTCPRGHPQQRLPDLDLERAAGEVQPRLAAPGEGRRHPRRDPLGRLDVGRLRPARPQVVHRRSGPHLRREGEPAEAAVGAHRQRRAEGRVEPAEGDVEALAGAGELAGAHRLPAQEEVVEAAGAREPGGERRVEHRVPFGEQALGVVEGEILLVALGADPHPLAEHPLEVRRAEPDRSRDLVERRLLGRAGDDVVDGAADDRVVVGLAVGLGHGRSRFGMAGR